MTAVKTARAAQRDNRDMVFFSPAPRRRVRAGAYPRRPQPGRAWGGGRGGEKPGRGAHGKKRDLFFPGGGIGPAVTSRGNSTRRNHGGACGGLRRLIPVCRKSAASASEGRVFKLPVRRG